MCNEVYRAINYGGDVCVGIASIPSAIGNSAQCVMHTASGVVGTALSLVTIGLVDKFNHTAKARIKFSAHILPHLYLGTISVLNLYVSDGVQRETEGYFRSKCDKIFNAAHTYSKGESYDGELLRARVKTENGCADSCSYVLKAWVAARILYAVAAVAATICRIADLVLGILSAVLSVLYVGNNHGLNQAAYSNLKVFGALEDLSIGMRGVFNPQQNYLTKERSLGRL